MAENKELPYKVAPILAAIVLIVLDVMVIKTAGTSHEDWLGNKFNHSVADWIGLIMFNASVAALVGGFFGLWSIWSSDTKSLGRFWLASLIVSILLIILW